MDIKMECETFLKLCHGCLSSDRKVQHITGEFSDIFFKLRNNDQNPTYSGVLLLCWECVAILKKVKTFQERIKEAQILLIDHLKSYCIKRGSIGPSCLSSLTTILNKTFNEAFYKQEILNNDDRTKTQDKEKHPNLKMQRHKTLNESSSIERSVSPGELNKGVMTELKLECDDNIKQEEENSENGNETDYNDVEYKDDNSNDEMGTDYSKIQFKVENDDYTERKSKVSLHNGINKRRKYARFATITKNESISTKNYKKICHTVRLNPKEYDEVLRKESDRLGSRLRYICEECKERFLKDIDLLRHISFYHNKLPYPQKCAACKATLTSSEKLSQHWTCAHTTMLKCSLCSDLYRSVAEMKRHIRDMHIKTYTCNECALVCSCFMEFKKHYKSHERVMCDHCRCIFRKKESLIKHIQLSHTPVACSICKQTYGNQRRLRVHFQLHHPEMTRVDTTEELSYCVECDKQYSSVLKYQRHLQQSVKHTPRKKISVPCPECGKLFSRTNFMRNHYKFAHLKITKHYCEKCEKYFTNGYGLRQHIERVHEKIAAPKTKVCDICGRAFGTNKILQNHRRTHTGEKPYKCPYCPASFAQQTAMKSHQKTQHKPDKLISTLT